MSCVSEKAQGCKRERRCRKSALTVHLLEFRDHQSTYTSAVKSAKATYFSGLATLKTKKIFFRIINHI